MFSRFRLSLSVLVGLAVVGPFACSQSGGRPGFEWAGDEAGAPEIDDTPEPNGFGPSSDAGPDDSGDASFVTCAATAVEAERERLPVDIIWMVDNSSSMAPAVAEVQAGLNAFANLIDSKGIDYKVVMLSKRGSTPTSNRHPICIPPPLGTADCGNGPRFFHASLDVRSTQPLEQFLCTLDQTPLYGQGEEYGSEPWSQELRPNATKSIVVVTDDNSRFSANDFEMFNGGKNPFNGSPSNPRSLPPGILHPSRGNQFKGYVFSGIYGWGSLTEPSTRCTYPNKTQPTASGAVYTDLVNKTGGVRAKICDGAAAWATFFDSVAEAVVSTSRVACDLEIPQADAGILDPEAVNVRVSDGTNPAVVVPRVANEAACGGTAGWYYDDAKSPSKVLLCPLSCEDAQSKGSDTPPKIEVLFGCQSVVR